MAIIKAALDVFSSTSFGEDAVLVCSEDLHRAVALVSYFKNRYKPDGERQASVAAAPVTYRDDDNKKADDSKNTLTQSNKEEEAFTNITTYSKFSPKLAAVSEYWKEILVAVS
ncbi:hypothetical protein MGYG_05364 [Nannizzia gypsea CBS 118893]|uniref:Uncharacterized protein n=1 Tax=Arthroderma gypseum (strain ATCC MYA-4604 / CBS 118893) TaxID=535722 RepID=E4UVP1_ARTGP|nr:hypothetical protein MGYG_05364 [Nannizzia gypsea CBS 118893]EFR02368.1 hypothetical protein MGYG_05364 [Nannizzia gypsea CBS 118893]